jgi:hypothetical protein
MEAVRKDVLEKIERDTVRCSGSADLDGVEALRNAENSVPRLRQVACGSKHRGLSGQKRRRQSKISIRPMKKPLGTTPKSQRFDAAKAVKTEREQF